MRSWLRPRSPALADEPVHVVATLPAGLPSDVTLRPNATVCDLCRHGLFDHAALAVTHGGIGATQKALARGVPVCVVPFGRDQFEVARRVEVAGSGTRLRRRSDRGAAVGRHWTSDDDDRRRATGRSGFRSDRRRRRGAGLIERRVLGDPVSFVAKAEVGIVFAEGVVRQQVDRLGFARLEDLADSPVPVLVLVPLTARILIVQYAPSPARPV